MVVQLLIIFAAGFLIDIIATKYTRFIADRKAIKATLLSGLLTLSNFLFLSILLKGAADEGVFNIIAFAGGNSLGTLFAMKKI